MMSHTEKQKLQKARAWFKFQLSGLHLKIKSTHLTKYERAMLAQLCVYRNILLNDFDSNSKKLGLNVPKHRCWCGREGKYEAEYKHDGLVCYKHRKNE